MTALAGTGLATEHGRPDGAATPRGATLVDPGLLDDIKRFGTLDVSACFSCGTCTAICPLSGNEGTFPRRMIRYGQVGMRDALLSSKELWACYHCGLCSDSCPQQADPGEYMAAARRYAIASYDRTRLARAIATSPLAGTLVVLAVTAFFALFLYADHGRQSTSSLKLFEFIPEGLVHWTGIAVFVALGIAIAAGLWQMVGSVARREQVRLATLVKGRAARRAAWRALWQSVAVDSIAQARYRRDCSEAQQDQEPLYRRRWLVHAMTMWGFLGLLAATLLDYLLSLAGVRATGTPEPVFYPVRLLGTLAGVAFVYGVTMLIFNRARRANRAVQHSTFSDWLLLVTLLVVALSGFLLELALYLPHAPAWGYWVLLFHAATAMQLMLLLPFTKFAHVVYRPVALFFNALAAERGPAVRTP